MFSRFIVSYEVLKQRKQNMHQLFRKAVLSQGIAGTPLVLHSDNGSSIKTATFQATLKKLNQFGRNIVFKKILFFGFCSYKVKFVD
jgi:transposase InsO family protein